MKIKICLPFQVCVLGLRLRRMMVRTHLRHKIRSILCCIDGQRLGDDEERTSKLRNGQLLPGTLQIGKKCKTRSVVLGVNQCNTKDVAKFSR